MDKRKGKKLLPIIPFRLSERGKEILSTVQEAEGLTNRTMTLEFLLRDYIKLKGLEDD